MNANWVLLLDVCPDREDAEIPLTQPLGFGRPS
jgi:hypothetical protein